MFGWTRTFCVNARTISAPVRSRACKIGARCGHLLDPSRKTVGKGLDKMKRPGRSILVPEQDLPGSPSRPSLFGTNPRLPPTCPQRGTPDCPPDSIPPRFLLAHSACWTPPDCAWQSKLPDPGLLLSEHRTSRQLLTRSRGNRIYSARDAPMRQTISRQSATFVCMMLLFLSSCCRFCWGHLHS